LAVFVGSTGLISSFPNTRIIKSNNKETLEKDNLIQDVSKDVAKDDIVQSSFLSGYFDFE